MRSSRLSIVNPAKVWVLVDKDNPFLETQCLGIAEAMDFPAHLYRVSVPWGWKYIPLWLVPDIILRVHSTPKPLMSPWPSLVICGGKVGLKIGSYLRKKHNSFTVAFGSTSSSFHKVVIESCQQGEKRNKIMTLGPLPRIHPEGLLQARQSVYRKMDHLPKPRIGLFLEGQEPLLPLIDFLKNFYKKTPFSLMIYEEKLSEERRKCLAMGFKEIPHLLWDGQGEDPYLGFLAHSETIIVSNSSSLMMAEASSVGKPLFIYPISSLDLYVQALIQKGYAALLTKESSLFSRIVLPPLQETQRVAQIVKEAYTEALNS